MENEFELKLQKEISDFKKRLSEAKRLSLKDERECLLIEATILELEQQTPAVKESLMAAQRRLWVIIGILRHNFKRNILQGISDKYEALGLVPSHYNFAPL